MRDEAPVYFNEKYGFYALFLYEDVCTAHKDWPTFTSTHGVDLSMLTKDPELIELYRSMIMMDPPEHDRMRALVSRVFTPRAISCPRAHGPRGHRVLPRAVRRRRPASTWSRSSAGRSRSRSSAGCWGSPKGERQQLRHLLDVMLHREPGRDGPDPRGMAAGSEFGAYFWALAGEKRRNPGDDMISRLTQVEVDRGDGQMTQLTDEEIAGFTALLGGAGAETVTKLVGNAAVLFHRNPDQYRKVVEDNGKIPGAVEETLRYYPPSQYQGRFATQDRELSGGTVRAGFPTLLVTGSACRDERFYDDPDVFNVERPPSLAIGFGYGIHSCLGAALARMESRIAIEELTKRWPTLRGGRGQYGPGDHVQRGRLRQRPGAPGRLSGRP